MTSPTPLVATISPEVHPGTAVLPVGSFEQHGAHLPLATDTLIATEIARRLAETYELFLLPPLCFSCSQEHAGFPGTVSIRAVTLLALLDDLAADLCRSGTQRLVVVNGHGGNNALVNAVQQANVSGPRMLLYPTSPDWTTARLAAGCVTTTHEDMHGGEAETSILLHTSPEVVRDGWQEADFLVDDRSRLTLVGMHGYTPTGIIGRPSLASADKGRLLLEALVTGADEALKLLIDERLIGGPCGGHGAEESVLGQPPSGR